MPRAGGSQGAGVSADFSEIGAEPLVLSASREGNEKPTPNDTPSTGSNSVLPIEVEFPQIKGSRIELINAVCLFDLGIGSGLEADQSQQLGYVTFGIAPRVYETYEIFSDANGPADGVPDGDGNEILHTTDITFNTASITIPEPSALPVLGSGIAALALVYPGRRNSVEP